MDNFNQLNESELAVIDGGALGGALGFAIIGASVGSLAESGVAIYHSATGRSSEAWTDVKAGFVTGAAYGPAGMIVGGAIGSGAGYLIGSLFD